MIKWATNEQESEQMIKWATNEQVSEEMKKGAIKWMYTEVLESMYIFEYINIQKKMHNIYDNPVPLSHEHRPRDF